MKVNMRKAGSPQGIHVTRALLKQEIDRVQEHLAALCNIIKVFELPAGTIFSDMDGTAGTASESDELMSWTDRK